MELLCRRCRSPILPDEQMVIVTLGRPNQWCEPKLVADRLEYSPGRWHYRCLPKGLRQYASAVST